MKPGRIKSGAAKMLAALCLAAFAAPSLPAAPLISGYLNVLSLGAVPDSSYTIPGRPFSAGRRVSLRSAADCARLGEVAFLNADYRKSAALFSRAVRLAPESSYYQQRLGEAYQRQAESSSLPARLVRRARHHLNAALRLDPSNVEALADLAEMALLPAGACYGDLAQASRLIDAVGRLDSRRADDLRQSLNDAWTDSHSFESRIRCAPVTLSHTLAAEPARHFLPATAVLETGF